MDNIIIIQRRNWIIITIKSNDKMIKDKAEIKQRRKQINIRINDNYPFTRKQIIIIKFDKDIKGRYYKQLSLYSVLKSKK